jgi:two-component system response regulator YesN
MHDLLNHPTDRFGTVGNIKESTAGLMPCGQPCWRTDDRRLLLVLMLIEDNTRRQLLMADIARTVNLSPGRLAHLFKSEMGVSPQRYLNNIRLDKAKERLESGVLSVKEIAAEVGIPDVSRFCRSFKARYGTTPKEYRKTHLRLDLKSVAPVLRACQNITPKV